MRFANGLLHLRRLIRVGFARSLADARKSFRLNRPRYGLLLLLARAGRSREATEILSQQLADDPDNTDVMTQIEEAVETAKPETQAAAMEPIRQIVLSHPGSLTLLAFFAGLDAKVGNVDEAVKMTHAAIERLNATG